MLHKGQQCPGPAHAQLLPAEEWLSTQFLLYTQWLLRCPQRSPSEQPLHSSEAGLRDSPPIAAVVCAAVEDGDEQREPSSGSPPRIHPHHMVMVRAA